MLPQELIDILETYDPEDFNIIFLKVGNEKSNPKFDIQVNSMCHENFNFRWTMETTNYRQSKIYFEPGSTLLLSNSHPLLWQFSEPQSDLYFTGNCSEADKLFVDLYKIHDKLLGDFTPFADTINQAKDFNKLMDSSGGLLASGSRKLVTKYASCLEKYNLTFSIVGDRIPTYWDGEKHITETGNAKVLIIDKSFIIADDFQFKI